MILACGTAAPLVSVIVPWIVPVAFVTWERISGVCIAAARTAKTSTRALVTRPDSDKKIWFSLIIQKLYAIGGPYGPNQAEHRLNVVLMDLGASNREIQPPKRSQRDLSLRERGNQIANTTFFHITYSLP